MNNYYRTYSCPYWNAASSCNQDYMYDGYECPYFYNPYIPSKDTKMKGYSRCAYRQMQQPQQMQQQQMQNCDKGPVTLKDYGPQPFVVNINEATIQNTNYRTALWTGKYLQVTLMSINVGDDIGLEIHPDVDQFLRIEKGQGMVRMGASKDNLSFQARVQDDCAIMVPAGTWHNVINTGNAPLKIYSIYAPPHHPQGTVEETKPTD